ncbi:hypothetical protein J2S46_001198 [Kitasatospora herbaricolor]|uniref:DUF6924 domain-containing protein n=1 Tax=Kitasatospora herbaricolor TaxID=68217 RepID=UPI00278DC14D|nr:hypothetical protein [Kitasatospora herbaricolor]MDQ0306642.1 hypothetical protein [Kitasatospora herbaricolor]
MLPAVVGRHDAALVIRTDFADAAAWPAVRAELSGPWCDGDLDPQIHVVDDPAWDGAAADDVIAAVRADEELTVVFLADSTTMRDHGHPLLAVAVPTRNDCASDEEFEAAGGTVRTVPAGIEAIHANLSIANLDFADVVDAARTDPAGVFRSFWLSDRSAYSGAGPGPAGATSRGPRGAGRRVRRG